MSASAVPPSATATASRSTTSACWATSTTTCCNASAAISRCCATGRRGRDRLVVEAQSRTGHIVGIDLDAQPASLQTLGDVAGHVAAGERIEYQLPGLGQEADEELRHRGRETRRVNG